MTMIIPIDLTPEARLDLRKFLYFKTKCPEAFDVDRIIEGIVQQESFHFEVSSYLSKSGHPEIISFTDDEIVYRDALEK